MLGDAQENLFGGINAKIMEALKRVTSVSDADYVPPGQKEKLDDGNNTVLIAPQVDYDHLKESDDYTPVQGIEDWSAKIKKAGLKAEENKNKVDALDSKGQLQGWYNKATDMGYINKELKSESLNEEASHLQMLYAIHNAIDKTEKDGTPYSDNIHSEMSRCGMNPRSQEDHGKLDAYVKDLTNGQAHTHQAYAAKKSAGRIVESNLTEAHLSASQESKREEYVMKLKKSADDFKNRYGDDWESVLYATATKMAKAAK